MRLLVLAVKLITSGVNPVLRRPLESAQRNRTYTHGFLLR